MPYLRIWKFRPTAGRTPEFVAAYGATGDWALLFRRHPGYLGTELLESAGDPTHYLTIDRWRRADDWQAFLDQHGADYRALDQLLSPLCAEEAELGNFTTS